MQPHLTENWLPQDPFRNSSRVMPPPPQAFEFEVYEWQVHGKAISIQINLDVVDRLQRDLLELAYRGAEVAGVLLGRVAASGFRTTVIVEGYELALDNGEPASSLAKQKQLADLVGKWNGYSSQRAVGLLRSQTRGGLSLTDQDLETAACLFPRLDNIFLVVRLTAGTEPRAGFFFWEGNQILATQCYSEFVFDARVLSRQSAGRMRLVDAEAEVLEQSPSPSLGRFVRNTWVTLGLTWGAALGCTLTCVNAFDTPDRNSTAAARPAPIAHPAKFKAEYHGQNIEVNLNHGLPSELERENGPLSDRQVQLLRYVAEDLPKDEIASKLGITPEAVEVHKEALAHKLGVSGEAGLVRYAIKAGLVQP
jgi:DNA-binding CsgD family transcriptional regulator